MRRGWHGAPPVHRAEQAAPWSTQPGLTSGMWERVVMQSSGGQIQRLMRGSCRRQGSVAGAFTNIAHGANHLDTRKILDDDLRGVEGNLHPEMTVDLSDHLKPCPAATRDLI